MKPINVGLLGIGTVGGGTWEVLNRNADEIQRRAGRAIRIAVVADKAVARAREIVAGKAVVTDDAFAVVRGSEVDIVVELIGGYTVAKDLVLEAIGHGSGEGCPEEYLAVALPHSRAPPLRRGFSFRGFPSTLRQAAGTPQNSAHVL